MNKLISFLFYSLVLFSCSKEEKPTSIPSQSSEPNILLIIADDMGLDAAPGYNIGTTKPNIPNVQNIINNGILFNNFWVNPTCTPTRASIITGKYAFRTQVTKVGDELSTTEVSLQKYLSLNTSYSNAVIGKWHLSRNANHPSDMGVDYYTGFLNGTMPSYTNWDLTENGQTNKSTDYSTTKFTDLSIDWINQQTSPWFLWLAYNAPHSPFHLPPTNLHTYGDLPADQASIDANPLPYYLAMIEAMDTEIGRLLNAMSEEVRNNTIIIFIGDNGTPNNVAQEFSSRRVKETVYKGGVNVPMYISGKGVSRINEEENALINGTDLFSTIANIAGVSTTEINDSKSFKGLLTDSNSNSRDYIYSEIGKTNGDSDYTIGNKTHKYIYFEDGSEALFNLNENPMENPNLLSTNQLPLSDEDEAQKEVLLQKLAEIRH
ncbi:sulfatase-like hydrolase/transferase [Algibacter miyuki]|uniref:Sulfatase-like hydrolase/transferase n=1 Tax=Algibacter miyuki TaxID=1306933 RepID=A0ABV5GZ41_9FLAO|nr:sulfatase-like hydrolase/transferase [Algibacter miyuki]MDN3666898.1 sulfatase-like hydrolase/transferase [Algibacter miyuki]